MKPPQPQAQCRNEVVDDGDDERRHTELGPHQCGRRQWRTQMGPRYHLGLQAGLSGLLLLLLLVDLGSVSSYEAYISVFILLLLF